MRNLINLIIRYHFFLIFIILEMIAFIFIINGNRFQKSSFYNSTNIIVGNINQKINDLTSYISLKEENEILAQKVAKLLSSDRNSFIIHYFKENQIIDDTIYNQQYRFTNAKVINNSTTKKNNYLTINKGFKHGIESEMGVISSNGVVGVIKDISENFSTVVSILNSNLTLSAKLKNQKYKGILYWNGASSKYANLSDIESHVKISVGDSIITSGYSTIFPEGFLIGIIEEFELDKSQNFYNIKVLLSNDFKKTDHVFIIKNLLKKEQLQLEELNSEVKN